MEKTRIEEKIDEIEEYLAFLNEITPETIEDYKSDLKTKAACERYCEKIIEGLVDLAFLILQERLIKKNIKIKTPENDNEVFDILSYHNFITQNLSDRLKDAKGMRNFIAHQYGKIEDDIVFESIKEKLGKDVAEFIKAIRILFK